ncbi:1-phosphatidylinositol phosphodiesterase [Ceratocystis lukuohia]|uniref:1-phosphatidylinositol phosphodiesterase n=1 Tax=Ceratocystis lukuohia TaxID=2019550 RepID=A0ABR4M978_9PEZI
MRFSLLAILPSLALSHAGSYHDTYDLWSFDVSDGPYADWMYHIADNTPLSSLSIPGTQSSMTDKLEKENLQTQSTPLAMQLTGGIRYIDISLQNGNDILLVTHRKAFTGYRLDDVLTTIYDFLDQHPHETVVLHIKMGNPLDKSQIFTELLTGYLSPGTPIGNRAAQHVYSKGPDGIITIPTLGEVRGKILILQDFNSDSYGQFGLPWSSPLISSHYFNFEAAKDVQVKQQPSSTSLANRTSFFPSISCIFSISKDGVWIEESQQRVLWLPPSRRPRKSVFAPKTIALGSLSGRITVIGFRSTD